MIFDERDSRDLKVRFYGLMTGAKFEIEELW